MMSVFNQHANKVTAAKHKKIEKVGDTKQRMLETKKSSKLMKVSKRNSRFALLEDGEVGGLTHKGRKVGEMEEFNDMYFGDDGEEADEEFQQMTNKLNFSGFEEDEEAPKE